MPKLIDRRRPPARVRAGGGRASRTGTRRPPVSAGCSGPGTVFAVVLIRPPTSGTRRASRRRRRGSRSGQCSSARWHSSARPGPKLNAGMPAAGEARDVGPALLARHLRAEAAHELHHLRAVEAHAARARPGPRPRSRTPCGTSARMRATACSIVRSGGKRWFRFATISPGTTLRAVPARSVVTCSVSRYSSPCTAHRRHREARDLGEPRRALAHRVAAQPRPRRVRGDAGHAHLDVEDAVAAHLDLQVGGLEQHGHRRFGEPRHLAQDAARGRCSPRAPPRRRRTRSARSKRSASGSSVSCSASITASPRLHVGGAQSVHAAALDARASRCPAPAPCRGGRPARPAAGPRRGPRQTTPLPERSTSPGRPRAAAAGHEVGDGLLVARDARDVDERDEQFGDGVGGRAHRDTWPRATGTLGRWP